MKSTAFIVTYDRDLPWFKWCLASIGKFWAEDSQILVNVDPSLVPTVQAIAREVIPDRRVDTEAFVQWGNNKGYMYQMWAKMTVDQRTDSDVFAYFDSDLIINRTIGLSTYSNQDRTKFKWYCEPYSSVAGSEPGATKWLNATWRAFNIRPEYEFMRRHIFVIWRDTLAGCRQYLESQHGPLADYLLNLPGNGTDVEFSEFNCLGFYAWLFHADRYSFVDVTKEPPGPSPVDQHHSWTGDPEQAHARFLQACEAADFHTANAKRLHEATEGGIPHPSPETESGVQAVGEMALPPVSKTGDAGSIPALPVKPREQENAPETEAPVATQPSEEAAPTDPQAPIDDPFEQDLAKVGFVKVEKDGEETYEKLPADPVLTDLTN